MESAIYSRSAGLQRLVVQRCKLHDPTLRRQQLGRADVSHALRRDRSASACSIPAGNHVIRYNECWSDMEHMFNDIIGGGSNGSFRGSPGPDSDIYGNFVSHCWDDGLEMEGGNRNVRVWDNYISSA